MKWTILNEDCNKTDPDGVSGLILRMENELRGGGVPIQGFHFMNSPMEMLRFSREIEDEVKTNTDGANLYVGFQTVDKLIGETKRYNRLVESGVKVIGFGQGHQYEPVQNIGLKWVPLERNTRALENQWFLISSSPTPIAFVGWETSAEEKFAVGGLSSPGKMFRGFSTDDTRVVRAMIDYLESVSSKKIAIHKSKEDLKSKLKTPIKKIMTITNVNDTDFLKSLRARSADIASSNKSDLLFFEISAASYLISPYPEENRKSWLRVLDENELIKFGRANIAKQIKDAKNSGVKVEAILPTTHGFRHFAEWADKEKVDVIIIPYHYVAPGVLDRLRGYSLKSLLDHTDKQVVVMEESGDMWLARQ